MGGRVNMTWVHLHSSTYETYCVVRLCSTGFIHGGYTSDVGMPALFYMSK